MTSPMNFAMQLTGKVKTRPMISCSECGREFQRNRKADLQRHMRIHTNEKPFVCPHPDCGKAFRQSSALKNHSNYHVRDTSFTCQKCQMNFFDKPTFNRHVREKHELEYVYACPVPGCGKHFKRKPVFKQHMQDKHAISPSDNELISRRVSAGPYLKAVTGSKAGYHSDPSPPSKFSEVTQSMRSPQMASLHLNGSVMFPSNPAVFGTDTSSPVLLTDPYASVSRKASAPTYTESMSHYAQPPSEYGFGAMPSDIWFPGSEGAIYDGQFLGINQYAAFMPMGPPAISLSPAPSPPRGSPNPSSFLLSSGTSSGNSGNGSPGSFSPHSRSSTISPVSPHNSPGSVHIHPSLHSIQVGYY
ncbi:hypothetical protein ACEPAF_6331 [Sanghuangporus sanghuang]